MIKYNYKSLQFIEIEINPLRIFLYLETINSNNFNMNKFLLSLMALLCLNFSLSQTTIGIQDFDGGVPTMTYTGGTVTTGTGPFPATVNYSSA